jgi:hypothetical protein
MLLCELNLYATVVMKDVPVEVIKELNLYATV